MPVQARALGSGQRRMEQQGIETKRTTMWPPRYEQLSCHPHTNTRLASCSITMVRQNHPTTGDRNDIANQDPLVDTGAGCQCGFHLSDLSQVLQYCLVVFSLSVAKLRNMTSQVKAQRHEAWCSINRTIKFDIDRANKDLMVRVWWQGPALEVSAVALHVWQSGVPWNKGL